MLSSTTSAEVKIISNVTVMRIVKNSQIVKIVPVRLMMILGISLMMVRVANTLKAPIMIAKIVRIAVGFGLPLTIMSVDVPSIVGPAKMFRMMTGFREGG